jgi:DNA repair protein RadC
MPEGEMDGRLPRYRITDLAIERLPRERLASAGAEQLSDAELVAVLLGLGIRDSNALRLAEAVLASVSGLSGLRRIRFDELRRVQEIGPARAAALKAAAALADRMAQGTEGRPVLSSPQDVADYLHDLANASTGFVSLKAKGLGFWAAGRVQDLARIMHCPA